MGLNNPLPQSMASECHKCGKILRSFVEPRQTFGPDKVIPASVLANAKGLAILTVLKAGFLGSARFGSGLVVARRSDGDWSAPSAIGTVGAGFGGQIGFELTDFVFILNDMHAVMTFAQAGSLTLGGNVSVAAGPIGRNAEAAGAASLKSVAAIFSYSKTKGLFAGVSLEGSAIIERRDANEKLYGHRYRAVEVLLGSVPAPREADALLDILRSPSFTAPSGVGISPSEPIDPHHGHEDDHEDGTWTGAPPSRASTNGSFGRSDSWREGGAAGIPQAAAAAAAAAGAKKVPPPRPTGPKPSMIKSQAVAMYTFDAAQEGDLGFAKGDLIEVVKKTDSENDWWTGRIGGREGIFPSNYVKIKE